jgi:FKBP-type peptidyl-prolyl cis-trans isomerase FklB
MTIKFIASMSLAAIIMTVSSCEKQKRQTKLTTEVDSVSYALGLDMANKVNVNFKDANHAAFIEGYEHALDTSKTKIKVEDLSKVVRTFFMKKQQEAMAKAKDTAAAAAAAEKEVVLNSNATTNLLSEADSVSYAIGLDMALKMKPNFEEINNALFVQGYREVLDTVNALLEVKDIEGVLRPFFMKKQQDAMEKQQVEAAKKAEEEFGQVKVDGVQFLLKNKEKEGVVTTDSGLQYLVLKKGDDSKKPGATDNVTVHYHGTTPDGTVFDSSVDRKTPASFGLNQVIKGWTEGLQLMGEGAKFKFFIPQELAYGANAPQRGKGPIKPFMPLIFEVELISIN